MSNLTAEKALTKAKIGLMSKPQSMFWSTVCMGLRHVIDDTVPTAGTDGLTVHYNPEFLMEFCKNNEERTGLVFHETGHVILAHMLRRGDRDPEKYNIAGDHVINIMATKAGFKLPEGGHMDMKYDGWSTEQIYDDLPDQPPPPPDGGGIGQDIIYGGSGDPDDPASGGSQKIQQAIDDLLVKGTMAAAAADQIGSVPAEVQRHVDKLLNPPIPWNRILNQFMTKFDRSRYNYRRPNRRFFPDVFVPKKQGEALGPISMAIDASASVTDQQFNNYVAGVHHVMKRFNPPSIDFLQFTTRIGRHKKIESMKELKNMEFVGRGGTNVDPVLEWAKTNKPMVQIIFSDGQFHEPQINPRVPVIWIIHDNPSFKAPFGKVIHFNIV